MKSEYLSFINDYTNILGKVEGITSNEVFQIEMSFDIKLPTAYKDFLILLGKETGNLLGSYYMEFPSVLENKADALSVINFDERKSKEEKPTIKDSYFFFAQWQGYNFFFFDCAEGKEDPPIYILTDSPSISLYKTSFTDFIKDEGLKPLLDIYKNQP